MWHRTEINQSKWKSFKGLMKCFWMVGGMPTFQSIFFSSLNEFSVNMINYVNVVPFWINLNAWIRLKTTYPNWMNHVKWSMFWYRSTKLPHNQTISVGKVNGFPRSLQEARIRFSLEFSPLTIQSGPFNASSRRFTFPFPVIRFGRTKTLVQVA